MAITKVRKGNRVIRVTDNELGRYLANGYTVCEVKQPPKKVVAEPKAVAEPIIKDVIKEEVVEETVATPIKKTSKRRK